MVIEDRCIERVAALIPEEPERLPGPTKLVSARQGEYEGGDVSQEPICIGIDVSKEGMDVAVRPTGGNWNVSYNKAGVDVL